MKIWFSLKDKKKGLVCWFQKCLRFHPVYAPKNLQFSIGKPSSSNQCSARSQHASSGASIGGIPMQCMILQATWCAAAQCSI